MRHALVIAAAVALATPAHAEKARFVRFAIGCPTEGGLLAVYRASDKSADTIQEIVSHYDCQMFNKSVRLTLVSSNALVSVVARPRIFSKDDWLYVRTLDLEH
jgi:hypothetical protein